MFVDNTKKIICLSVPGTDTGHIERLLRSQSIDVTWLTKNIENLESLKTTSQLNDPEESIREVDDLIKKFENIGTNSNITELIDANILQFPINEYDVYGICIDPLVKNIKLFDLFLTRNLNQKHAEQLEDFNRTIEEFKAISDNPDFEIPEPPPAPNIRALVLNALNASYIEEIGHFALERYKVAGKSQKPQVNWLKYQGQNINHIYKYDNYLNFVSDICTRYNIDPSLYNDAPRLNARGTDISVNDLSEELQSKILEKYAEDKALYDSL